MRNLFQFLIRNSSWLMAIVLIAISLYLVFSYNSYQRSIYLSSANRVTGWVYKASSEVDAFMHLKKNNRSLLEHNARLEEELSRLKAQLSNIAIDSMTTNAFVDDSTTMTSQFSFIPAEVTNISFSGNNNFITVNKGALDGVKPDMGVVSNDGVVGVVLNVSRNYSVIIPIINPKFRLSAKIKGSESTGSVSWDGKNFDVAQLRELPKHETFEQGDTILTSFSRIFPKNIVIGYATEQIRSKDDNFNALNIELATDFHSLMGVLIIEDKNFEEKTTLENSVQ